MEQIISSWNGLDLRKKVIVTVATIAMFAALVVMAQIASKPSMSLLYADLDDSAAADVLTALEQRGIAHEVRARAIYVASNKKDALRLELAGEGLPNNGPQGYEILDGLSGFGTTSQMFDAAYWRAKEGELARTILASPDISAARVHIARSSRTLFQRKRDVTASVFISAVSGRPGSDAVRAIQHLVASAVASLEPNDVSVMDKTGLLTAQDAQDAANNTAVDLSAVLKDRVTRLLEARVGQNNAVVEVSVDTNHQTESIIERRFDPDSRVAISVDTEERSRNSEGGNASLSVASNLPDGDANQSSGNVTADTETRERVNYEVSETTREINRHAGEILRLTVAVLVNGTQVAGPDGSTFTPLPEAELDALRGLVASAIGFDEARGDVITLHSLEFDEAAVAGTEALIAPWYANALNFDILAKLGLAGIFALLIGMLVVRPILKSPAGQQDILQLAQTTPIDSSAPEIIDSAPMDFSPADGELPVMVPDIGFLSSDVELSADGAEVVGGASERLKTLMSSRADETIEVLTHWLDTENKVTV